MSATPVVPRKIDRLSREVLPMHERERELAAQIGAGRSGEFWASLKRGGPAHFWTHAPNQLASHSDMHIRLCDPKQVWTERRNVGKVREVLYVKRVCKECRMLVVALDR